MKSHNFISKYIVDDYENKFRHDIKDYADAIAENIVNIYYINQYFNNILL
jgi:hypothetical protein